VTAVSQSFAFSLPRLTCVSWCATQVKGAA
jgi:hypothetical protein